MQPVVHRIHHVAGHRASVASDPRPRHGVVVDDRAHRLRVVQHDIHRFAQLEEKSFRFLVQRVVDGLHLHRARTLSGGERQRTGNRLVIFSRRRRPVEGVVTQRHHVVSHRPVQRYLENQRLAFLRADVFHRRPVIGIVVFQGHAGPVYRQPRGGSRERNRLIFLNLRVVDRRQRKGRRPAGLAHRDRDREITHRPVILPRNRAVALGAHAHRDRAFRLEGVPVGLGFHRHLRRSRAFGEVRGVHRQRDLGVVVIDQRQAGAAHRDCRLARAAPGYRNALVAFDHRIVDRTEREAATTAVLIGSKGDAEVAHRFVVVAPVGAIATGSDRHRHRAIILEGKAVFDLGGHVDRLRPTFLRHGGRTGAEVDRRHFQRGASRIIRIGIGSRLVVDQGQRRLGAANRRRRARDGDRLVAFDQLVVGRRQRKSPRLARRVLRYRDLEVRHRRVVGTGGGAVAALAHAHRHRLVYVLIGHSSGRDGHLDAGRIRVFAHAGRRRVFAHAGGIQRQR